MAEKYLIQVDDNPFAAEIDRLDDSNHSRVRLQEDGEWKVAELQHVRAGLHVVMIDNRPVELYLERRGAGVDVTIGRRTYHVQIGRGRRAAAMQAAARDGLVRIRAPMTGSVLEIRTEVGDEIDAGDVLVVIESMKMNNELRAPAAGVVERVGATVDGQVEEGDEIVVIRPRQEENGSPST